MRYIKSCSLGKGDGGVDFGGYTDPNPNNSYQEITVTLTNVGGGQWLIEDLTKTGVAPAFFVGTYNVVSRTESHVYIDGDSTGETSNNSGTVTDYSSTARVTIGFADDSLSPPGSALTGWIQAVMLYSPALSAPDRQTMEAALKTKYGTP